MKPPPNSPPRKIKSVKVPALPQPPIPPQLGVKTIKPEHSKMEKFRSTHWSSNHTSSSKPLHPTRYNGAVKKHYLNQFAKPLKATNLQADNKINQSPFLPTTTLPSNQNPHRIGTQSRKNASTDQPILV